MSTRSPVQRVEMLDELLERIGGVPAERVVMNPFPGTATEADLLNLMSRTGKLYELVDGVLVEKAMGYLQGSLGGWLIRILGRYLDDNDLGDLAGSDATMRIIPGRVRLPDVSFTRWERMPNGEIPMDTAIPSICPDLAIEVLSRKNTPGEIQQKLKDYFLGGTSLAWIVDPRKRTVRVHTRPDESTTLTEADTLDGGDVLPGFTLAVSRVFERLPKVAAKPARKPRKKK